MTSSYAERVILLRRIRLMLLTEGTLYLSQTASASNLSRISHAKMPGSFSLYRRIASTTRLVVTRGLLPPIVPGKIDPVSLYRARILLTQPCDTCTNNHSETYSTSALIHGHILARDASYRTNRRVIAMMFVRLSV